MEKTRVRESGFELLRIIAMVMIVANHLVNHGILKVSSPDPNVLWPGGSVLNRLLCALLTSGGRVGVAVFFMISGYFLAEQEKISVRSLRGILGKVHYFGAVMLGLLFVLNRVVNYGAQIDLHAAARESLCIPLTVWWFTFAYTVLLFLAPSLNILVASFRQKWAFVLLILYIWFFFYRALGDFVYDDFIKAVFFYLIGAWVRRTFGPARKASVLRIGLFFCLCLAAWLLAGFLSWVGLCHATAGADAYAWSLPVSPGRILNNAVIPLFALSMLLLFREVHFSSGMVNRIAGCTFGVYLFHDYTFTRAFLWHSFLKTDTLQFSSRWFPAYILLDILLIFSFGILLELLRELLVYLGTKVVFRKTSRNE